MLPVSNVIATTYMDVCGTGRNRPCRFSCVNSDNISADYIVKFHGSIGPRIICEFVGSILAKTLGFNTPGIAIVHSDLRLAGVIPDAEARENFKKKSGPHFGSLDLGIGMSVMNPGYSLRGRALEQAVDIFAFDMLIQNTDRSGGGGAGKPNILFKGDDLFLIDHELAFSFINVLFPKEPWELRKEGLAERHLFYTQVKKHSTNNVVLFDRIIQSFSGIRLDDIQEALNALPSEWHDDRYVSKILSHFDKVLSNVDKFHRGLLEVFV